ncbi:MAG: EAL domain-containing protein [Pseudomonadota bacterium]
MNKRKKPVQALGQGAVDPLSAAVTARDKSTLDMVKEALKTKRAVLAYQPVVQALHPERPAFYEGLVRILDVTGRPIPAKDFMAEVEDTETGREIDCVTLELGLETLAQEEDVRLSINMSARSIGYSRWVKTLEDGLAKSPTSGERLILEIEEKSAMTTPELVSSFMRDLQGRGISFALDDFGAGFTSFRYLREFLFDLVKINGKFTRNVNRNVDNQVVVGALVAVGKQFDMFTVAGSVESAKDAEFLTSIGVDCLQGFHFGAPSLSPPWKPQEGRRARI